MGIGVSIFLIVVGLILVFVVYFDIFGFDINVIGWIFVIVGIIGFIMIVLVFALWCWWVVICDVDVVEECRVYDDCELL